MSPSCPKRQGAKRPGPKCQVMKRPGQKRPRAKRPGPKCPGAKRHGAKRPGAKRHGAKRPGAKRHGAKRPRPKCQGAKHPGPKCRHVVQKRQGAKRPGPKCRRGGNVLLRNVLFQKVQKVRAKRPGCGTSRSKSPWGKVVSAELPGPKSPGETSWLWNVQVQKVSGVITRITPGGLRSFLSSISAWIHHYLKRFRHTACLHTFLIHILYRYGLSKGMILYNFRNTHPHWIKSVPK